MTIQEQYDELSFYTLAHKGNNFIHQHIVDAFTAQTANERTKPISIFFALAGLYLFTVKNYTGTQVQAAHLAMAKKTKTYEQFILPGNKGAITIQHVAAIPPGPQKDEMIREWCRSVWAAYSNEHDKVISLTEKLLTSQG